MRGAVALAIAAAALCACAAGGAGTSANGTALTVSYWEKGRSAERQQWTLRCNPPRGTLARPANACSKLASGGTKLFAPSPRDVACIQLYGGPQVARVVGTVNGKQVWASFGRGDGCQIARWERLSPWLLPPGGVR